MNSDLHIKCQNTYMAGCWKKNINVCIFIYKERDMHRVS